MAAPTAMLSLPRINSPVRMPGLPSNLPQIRPLGSSKPAFQWASSVDRVGPRAANFVRPDVPPPPEATPSQPLGEHFSAARLRMNGRSVLEQAAFVTNNKLADVRRAKGKASVFRLGIFGL